MTHRGPFQPLLFCDSVKDVDGLQAPKASKGGTSARGAGSHPQAMGTGSPGRLSGARRAKPSLQGI